MLNSEQFWQWLWLSIIAAAAVAFVVVEFGSILYRWHKGLRPLQAWTLSDFVRRWSNKYHNIPAVIIGLSVMLILHLWWIQNP